MVYKCETLNRELHGQGLSVIIDDDVHPPFLRSDFFENMNGAGGERRRGSRKAAVICQHQRPSPMKAKEMAALIRSKPPMG